MNTQNSKTLLVVAAALSLTPFANAQTKVKDETAPPPPSMVGLPGANRYGTDPLHLLQTAKVKQELKISDDQSAKLAKVADKYDREAASRLGNVRMDVLTGPQKVGKQQEIREAEDKLIETSRKEVSAILTPEQLDRLKQILLQVNGAEALQDKEVAQKVGITPEETAKLQKLQLKTNAMLRSSVGTQRSSGQDQTQLLGADIQAADKIDNKAQEQYRSALTPEQKEKLDGLVGAPFKLDRTDVVGK
jgi:Spy/CpxP family protein refolding chaperone